MNKFTKKKNHNIIVVVAHPHDFTHCAGTCGIHAKRGDHITVVVMSDGATVHNEKYHDELLKPEAERDPGIINQTRDESAKIKRTELIRGCKIFGVTDVRFLTADPNFRAHREERTIRELADIILEVRPDIGITHNMYLNGYLGTHGLASWLPDDHCETARAFYEAINLSAQADYQSSCVPHDLREIFYMGIFGSEQNIDFYVDISDWYQQRVELEEAFVSQGHDHNFAERRMVTDIGHQGWRARTHYAEGFVRADFKIVDSLDICDERIRRDEIPHLERMKEWVPENSTKQ